jgi:hypothetical protein
MAKIELTSDALIVHVTGIDVVLALRSTFSVPLANVRGAVARPPDAHFDSMNGLRIAGGYLPKSFAAGLFWVTGGLGAERQRTIELLSDTKNELDKISDDPGGHFSQVREHVNAALARARLGVEEAKLPEARKHWAFYDVHDPAKAIGIDVEHQKVSRIVVQVDDETPDEAVARITRAIAR